MTFHVFSGDCAADLYRAAGGDGDVLVWREALAAGPTPAANDFVDRRARFLAGDSGMDEAECRRQLEEQEAALATALGDGRNVVLWFARDLWCELQLLYIVSEIAGKRAPAGQLSIVCPDQSGTPGFPCFGALDAGQVVALATTRRALSPAERADAARAWAALSSDDPTEIDRCLPALSFEVAREALAKQRARFPSASTGLGRTEQVALEQIAAGSTTIDAVMSGLSARLADYCWTDLLVESEIAALGAGAQPLVHAGAGSLAVTAIGKDVLAGRGDRVHACGIDTWIGGAHLTAARLWRFDAAADQLVAG